MQCFLQLNTCVQLRLLQGSKANQNYSRTQKFTFTYVKFIFLYENDKILANVMSH